MKIGIVTEYFYPTLGGIAENIYHLSLELLKRGHDFRIITGYRGEPTEIDDQVKRRTLYVGRSIPVFLNGSCGRITLGFGLTKHMKALLQRERFDLLHLHSPLIPMLPLIANMQANAPMVGTLHTCTGAHHFLYRIYGFGIRWVIERMAGLIAVSECCAMEHRRFFNADSAVIPNGVDVDWWANGGRKISRFDDGKINVLFLGRPDRRNGLDTLIDAFSAARRVRPDLRLIVVGDGPLRSYFQRLVPDNLRDSIIFEGACLSTRPDYMASAHIFCFTPTIASFGITILEGMSAGKAMIASDIEAFRALVTHEESALLVKPGHREELAQAILRLAHDEALRARLGQAAAIKAQPYDWKRVTDLHLEYYNKILKGSGIRDQGTENLRTRLSES
jgi:phosphatidylinositol alpha-mannosyltransferase